MSIASSTTHRNTMKCRVVLLGDQGVGKTSFIQRYTTNKFDETCNTTIGIDFNVKDVTYQHRNYRIQIWDTAGQERYRSLIPSYLKNAHFAILMFDITKVKSLEDISIWHKLLLENQDAPAIVVGNKCDLQNARKVSYEAGAKFAQGLGLKYIETSAKTGKKIQQTFKIALQAMQQIMKVEGPLVNSDLGSINKMNKSNSDEKKKLNKSSSIEKKKSCC